MLACAGRAITRSEPCLAKVGLDFAKVLGIDLESNSRYWSKFCRNYREIWGDFSEISRKNLGGVGTKLLPRASREPRGGTVLLIHQFGAACGAGAARLWPTVHQKMLVRPH